MKYFIYLVLVFLLFLKQSESLSSNAACEGCRLLTPLIKADQASKARLLAQVPPDQFLGLESYSGFITVKEEYDSNLFFWFFPGLDKKPLGSTPWIIWLQGGPGFSSLYGLFNLVGPIKVENGQVLHRNSTLSMKYPVLFIDNPVGAGYSYTGLEEGYTDNEDDIGDQLLEFLKQFLEMFPEMGTASLFIAGESYAGKYIPALGFKIHSHNMKEKRVKQSGATSPQSVIHLRGLIIGGAMINPVLMMNYSSLVSSLGLLNDHQIGELREIEQDAVKFVEEKIMVDAANKFNETIEYIKKHSQVSVYNFIEDPANTQSEFEVFVQRPEIRLAIGAGNASFDMNNQLVYEKMLPDIMNSTQPFVEELLSFHYPVLCYHGQQDIIMAYSLAKNTYRALRWDNWRKYQLATRSYLRDDDGRTLGYVQSGGGFTDMLLRHAGHMVPRDMPDLATYIHYHFIEDNI